MTMSKAEALGPSSAFGAAATPRSSRRDLFAKTVGGGADAITSLPLEDISLNPDNPRSELGDLRQLAGSLKDHGQKTAISIMGREAYLEANPGRAAALEPNTRYVAIDGNSRLAAAREAGLTTIKVMVDDDLGADPNELLESALVANVHRKDLDPLDEARALQTLLKIHENQEALAARLHRSQGWISQRLGLLTLTPELQERLKAGQESPSNLRAVGRKPPEQQEAALAKLKAEQDAVKEARKTAKAAAKAPVQADAKPAAADGYYGVMTKPDAATATPGPDRAGPGAEPSVTTPVPEPRAEEDTAAPADTESSVVVRVQAVPDDNEQTPHPPLFLRQYLQTCSNVDELVDGLCDGVDVEGLRRITGLLRMTADMMSSRINRSA